MPGERILITGTTGMIGYATLVQALRKGYNVRAAVRTQAGFDKIITLLPVKSYVDQLECFIVPDITIPGAYDEAVKGVEYVIHIAAPLAQTYFTDFEKEVIQPSVMGTIGMLESASKERGIKRIVITGSIASVAEGKSILTGPGDIIYTEKSRTVEPAGPYSHVLEAYMASKALAFQASQSFMSERDPSFDLVTIGPGFVIGRDETVTAPDQIGKGTNGFMIGQLFGQAFPLPVASVSVHLGDVAKLHVEALNPSIPGNQMYLAAADGTEGPTWADVVESVKRHYPKEVADGIFKVDAGSTGTLRVRVDSSFTEKIFDLKFQPFEKQVLSVTDHFLELLGRKPKASIEDEIHQ